MITTSSSSVKDSFSKLSYIVTTPTGFEPAKESLPLIVYLHGVGESGDNIEAVKTHGIPKYFCKDQDYLGLRVVTLSPQCPWDKIWNGITVQLMNLIEIVANKLNIDKNRITITGNSMGGFGTWEMACEYNNYFAAAAPICGGGMSWRASALAKMPVRAFHGSDDLVVPIEYSKLMVDTINAAHGHAELTVFDNVGHDSWTSAYEKTDLIKWLASAEKQG